MCENSLGCQVKIAKKNPLKNLSLVISNSLIHYLVDRVARGIVSRKLSLRPPAVIFLVSIYLVVQMYFLFRPRGKEAGGGEELVCLSSVFLSFGNFRGPLSPW